jgi:hypothetical protein
MRHDLTDFEREKIKLLVAAMEFRGFTAYRPEVYREIAQHCDLTALGAEDFAVVLREYQERPAPHALAARLRAVTQAPPPPDVTAPQGTPLAAYRMALRDLPVSYQRHLRDRVRSPEFITEWSEREGADPAVLRKGLAYTPHMVPMACAMLYAWELQDGRITRELLDMAKGEETERLQAKEAK